MFHAGDTIENPVTGERIRFRRTSAETNGELVEIEVTLQSNGFVAAAHVHPYQTERFEMVFGTMEFRVRKERFTALAGDVITVEPGTPHGFRNLGPGDSRFVTEVRPALQFERLIRTMFTLAAAGKTNRRGMPNPVHLAVIAKEHFDDVQLPFPAAWVQRVGLSLGAPLGRLAGYRPDYGPAVV
jgi:quercetin dioxygenase-like cupin family protein